MRLDEGLEDLAEAALAAGTQEVADQGGGRDEERVVAILDGLVGDGGSEVSLAATAQPVRIRLPRTPSTRNGQALSRLIPKGPVLQRPSHGTRA